MDPAGVEGGMPWGRFSRSSTPKMAARAAPYAPNEMSHIAPESPRASDGLPKETRSKTKAHTQAPIGTVTKMGWAGSP